MKWVKFGSNFRRHQEIKGQILSMIGLGSFQFEPKSLLPHLVHISKVCWHQRLRSSAWHENRCLGPKNQQIFLWHDEVEDQKLHKFALGM